MIEEDQDTSITEKRITDSIYKWLEGDVSDIKEQVKEYRKKLEEAQRQQSGNIDIAPPNFVDALGNQNKKGKRWKNNIIKTGPRGPVLFLGVRKPWIKNMSISQ